MDELPSVAYSGLSRWVKEPFAGMSHLLGAGAAVVGMVVLLMYAPATRLQTLGIVIYGVSMVTLFLASTAAHSLHCTDATEKWLLRFDYAAIFFLIAGTYTPLCLGVLSGTMGTTILVLQWTLAGIGITLVLGGRGGRTGPILLYIPMGWMILLAIGPVLRLMPTQSLVWLLAGGAMYSVGAVVFATNRPRLWPGRFGAHDLWHVMVLAGCACHFVTIFQMMRA